MPNEDIATFEQTMRLSHHPYPDFLDIMHPEDLHDAKYQFEIIKQRIQQLEETLDNNRCIAVKLASFGHMVMLTVKSITYANPSILIFEGTVDNSPATLIQHVSQLNFLILTIERNPSETSPRAPIGFRAPSEA